MKKSKFILIILAVLLVVTACQKKNKNGSKIENENEVDQIEDNNDQEENGSADVIEENPSLSDYFPFKGNTLLDYQGEGVEYAEEKVFFEYIDGNKAQIRITNPATSIVKVVELKDGILKEIFSEAEFYHLENVIDQDDYEDILLMEPLEVGTSWTSGEGDRREITALDSKIETPYGQLQALEVTSNHKDGKTYHYYSPAIGLVGEVYQDQSGSIKTLLKSIEEGPQSLNMEMFYPHYDSFDLVYLEDKILFETNQDPIEILDKILRTSPEDDLIALLPDGAKLTILNWIGHPLA